MDGGTYDPGASAPGVAKPKRKRDRNAEAIRLGFKGNTDYRNHLARQRGYKSWYDEKNGWARGRGHEGTTGYKNSHARTRGTTYHGQSADYYHREARSKNALPGMFMLWGQDGLEEFARGVKQQKLHIDHMIPVNGWVVSGLHVRDNLQPLSAKENLAKGNRVDPELFQLWGYDPPTMPDDLPLDQLDWLKRAVRERVRLSVEATRTVLKENTRGNLGQARKAFVTSHMIAWFTANPPPC